MGKKIEKKLLILIILLLPVCLLVFSSASMEKVNRKFKLRNHFNKIDGYRVISDKSLDEEIYSFLELDDYKQTDYRGKDGNVNLYIGYYYTADKVSAAHSPLACLPGNGWTITDPEIKRLTVGDKIIQYAELEATIQNSTQLVIYWYQAHHTTTPHVYKNKMNTLYNKLTDNEEQHAFMRVMVPYSHSTKEKARESALDFIEVFYPQFIDFVSENKIVEKSEK